MAMQNNGDDHDARTIHCANLSDRVSDALLYELFLQAGPLERVSIPKEKDGTQRSYGFITYKHTESVPYAIGIFNGTKLFNREIRMNNRCANNTNGNRQVPNQNELLLQQKTQMQLQQFYQMQSIQLQQQQQQQLQLSQPHLLQNDINAHLLANTVNPNQVKPSQERNERNDRERERERHRGEREKERARSRDKNRDRQRKRDRSKDITALKGSVASPSVNQQSMLPAANPFAKKTDDLTNKAFDINALLSFSANMLQSNQLPDNNGHNLQSKMMHRHENRPHHQNANYSRWNEHDRRGGGGGGGGGGRDDRRGADRRGNSDFNRRNRHDRR